MFGFIGIIFFNFLYNPDISKIPNLEYANSFIKTLIIISVSYFLGRMFYLIGSIWIECLYFLFGKNKAKKIKSVLKQFLSFANNNAILNQNNRNFKLAMKVRGHINENQHLRKCMKF